MSPPKSADGSKRSIASKSCCSWRHGLNTIQGITVSLSSGTLRECKVGGVTGYMVKCTFHKQLA